MAPSKRKIIDDSESDEEADVDVNSQLQSLFSQPDKKRAKRAQSSDQDDGGDDSSDSEFDDGYDANFMGDEKDRQYLNSLSDLKRSEILFAREEERNKQRERWNIRRSLKAKRKGVAEKNGRRRVSTSARDTPKNKQSAALSQIRASRNQKRGTQGEAAGAKQRGGQRALSSDSGESSSSSSSEEEDDDDDLDDEYVQRRRSKKKSRRDSSSSSGESDGESEKEDESKSKTDNVPITFEFISKMKVSRNRLEKWIEEPFLETAVTGAFVRVLIGNHAGRPIYRLCEVVKVVTYHKDYKVGDTKTNLALELRHAEDTRVFRMEYVSNSPATESEFTKWKDAMTKANQPILTEKRARKKEGELNDARNFVHTEEHNQELIKRKKDRRKEALAHQEQFIATDKNEILTDLKKARIDENHEEVKRLEALMEKVEVARERDLARKFQRQDFVKRINERNRKRNEDLQVVAQENKKKLLDSKRGGGSEQTKEAGKGEDTVFKESKVPIPSVDDLFSQHDFDLDIDIQTPGNSSQSLTTSTSISRIGTSGGDMGTSASATFSMNRNILSIERYKEANGLL